MDPSTNNTLYRAGHGGWLTVGHSEYAYHYCIYPPNMAYAYEYHHHRAHHYHDFPETHFVSHEVRSAFVPPRTMPPDQLYETHQLVSNRMISPPNISNIVFVVLQGTTVLGVFTSPEAAEALQTDPSIVIQESPLDLLDHD